MSVQAIMDYYARTEAEQSRKDHKDFLADIVSECLEFGGTPFDVVCALENKGVDLYAPLNQSRFSE